MQWKQVWNMRAIFIMLLFGAEWNLIMLYVLCPRKWTRWQSKIGDDFTGIKSHRWALEKRRNIPETIITSFHVPGDYLNYLLRLMGLLCPQPSEFFTLDCFQFKSSTFLLVYFFSRRFGNSLRLVRWKLKLVLQARKQIMRKSFLV